MQTNSKLKLTVVLLEKSIESPKQLNFNNPFERLFTKRQLLICEMYSLIKKSIFLMFYLRGVYIKCSFCDHDKFEKIYMNKIIANANNTYSLIDIIIHEQTFQWNLETNKISLVIRAQSQTFTKIFIPDLPKCADNTGDCHELHKLSNTAITFSVNGNAYSYRLTKYVSNEEIESPDTELPWNMSASGIPRDNSKHNLWPNDWIEREGVHIAAYEPKQKQLVYFFNPERPHERLNIKYKSLSSQNWAEDWKVIETETKTSFIGLITLMAVQKQTGLPIRNKMDRIFGFVVKANDAHQVFEYVNNELISSDYNYYSLFGCPEPKPEESVGLMFALIGGCIVVIVLILISFCIVLYFFSGPKQRTTGVVMKSSSGSVGSSKDSIAMKKKGSRSSRQS